MTLRVHLARHPARETVDVSVWRKLDRGRAAIFGPITCESKEVEADCYGYSEPSARLTEHELTDLYRSLGDELRRIGSLPAEPSWEKVEQLETRIRETRATADSYFAIITMLTNGTTRVAQAPDGCRIVVREVLAGISMLSSADLAVVRNAIRLIEAGNAEYAEAAQALADAVAPPEEEREYTGTALEISVPDPVTEREDADEPTYDSSHMVEGQEGFYCNLCDGAPGNRWVHHPDCVNKSLANPRDFFPCCGGDGQGADPPYAGLRELRGAERARG